MIRAVLFDMDGVLVDTRSCHYEALNRALAEHGCATIPPETHRTLYDGLPTATKLRVLVDRGLVPPDKVGPVSDAKKRNTVALLKETVRFDPRVYCLVAGLRARGLRTGVVSNAVPETVISVCDELEILSFMGVIVSNADGPPKPDPFPYRTACERLWLSPSEVLAIEDGAYGVESATAAGCVVVRVGGPSEVTPENVWRHLC